MLPIFNNFPSDNNSPKKEDELKRFAEDLAIFHFDSESDEEFFKRISEILEVANDVENFLGTRPVLKKIIVLESLSLIVSDILSDLPQELVDIWKERMDLKIENIKKYIE